MSSGSSSSNDAIIKQANDQAAKAEAKEAARQERLRMGRERILAMSTEGGGTWSESPWEKKIDATGGPATQSQMVPFQKPNRGGSETSYRMTDVPNPNYRPGYTVWQPGKEHVEKGIGSDFYDGYKNSILDYYKPEVEKQYENAQSQNLFDLGRRGTLQSSVAADRQGDLVEDRVLADARVAQNAENQTAGVRKDMSRAQQNAMQLLQQTEDPTTAANMAATEVNAIQSQGPQFDPLGEMFRSAALGYGGYQQNKANKAYANSIQPRDPYASSGRTIG